MDISDKLSELGMYKLPRTRDIAGFVEVVTFVIPERVQMILAISNNLDVLPDIAIVRGGKVGKYCLDIVRQLEDEPMTYSLAKYYDDEAGKRFEIISSKTNEKIKGVYSDKYDFVTSNGILFTAKKYLEGQTKKAQN